MFCKLWHELLFKSKKKNNMKTEFTNSVNVTGVVFAYTRRSCSPHVYATFIRVENACMHVNRALSL